MAKCIVCSKSAGPFYSLHRACHSVYRNTLTCLEDKLSSSLLESSNYSKIIEEVQACKPATSFSSDLFDKLFIKAWSTQANQCVKSSALQVERASNLIQLANEHAINEEALEPYLLTRLKNIQYLDSLQRTNTIEKHFESIPEIIELTNNEFILWQFEKIGRSEPLLTSDEKQWTVLRSVMNNMILKSRYKQLPSRTENEGVLVVSNEALYYVNKNKLTQTKYSDIHSVTPMKNGVRVQASTSGSTPDTYVTGDGRFTYSLLQYAQGLNA